MSRARTENTLRVVAGGSGGKLETVSGEELPLETTSFVGRGRELSEVEGLLGRTRLLTLVGVGGSGKTRLALRVAMRRADEGDVWWVELASLSDSELVPKKVASTLGVAESPKRQTGELLVDYLGSREALLILDNCEHLVGACATLADVLLRACPRVRILATSREPLGVAGEVSWTVPPLSLPEVGRARIPKELLGCEAVGLFVERVGSVEPGFALTEENATAVVDLCARLDGLPLAIELAASRVKVLSVGEILERLDDRFRLLRGNRTAVPRHRTLEATIDWSHGLLSEQERTLFRRLSVFAGGWTLSAVEDICSGDGIEKEEVLELLASLVDKSLVVVVRNEQESRYRMLETVRQYASVKLGEAAEREAVSDRHANFLLDLAERAETRLAGPEQAAWLDRLEAEHDNLRVALVWLTERGEAERGLMLAAALLRFWWFRGHLAEGRMRLEGLLDLRPTVPVRDEVRAKALHTLAIHRFSDDTLEDWTMVRSRLQESLKIYRRLGDEPHAAAVLRNLGRVRAVLGDWTAAYASLNESLEIMRRSGTEPDVALSLFYLGMVQLHREDLSPARANLEDGLELFRKLEDKFWVNACLVHLAYIDCEEGAYGAARSRLLQTNDTLPLVQFPWGATYVLDGFSRLAVAQGESVRALRLGGATDALRQTYGVTIGPTEQAAFRRRLEPARRVLGEEAGDRAWEEGRAMTLEEAVDLALTETGPGRRPNGLLSDRELEVLRLVASGFSDVEVAENLYLSPRTVGGHLGGIYRKLAVKSRTAAVKKAGELGLI
ncbi:MAG TPA: LuxR C-terminal-related transcriptional regulator [Rubrobacter sp.]|nr:LuxR C-terminal-related transcriptional regulator [Rubrobacter sp.]